MRKLIFILMFLSSLCARDALAACLWLGNPPPLIKDIVLPSNTIIKAAPIGAELARHEVTLWNAAYTCQNGDTLTTRVSTALKPVGFEVYETGVKGLGVRFCLRWYSRETCPYYSQALHSSVMWPLPDALVIKIIRTGRDVESGKSVPMEFTIDWLMGGAAHKVKGKGTTELVNDVYFSGCESVGAAVNVQMGKQTIQHIKNGSAREVPFNFDVRCSGLKSGAKVPVKVYFEGASQGDGMLKLSNLGQAGVASGVGISLVNDKGAKLPFDIARSIGLDWNRDAAEGSIYRFSGKAKYAPTGGEMKPGKGDATMSFVLNYN